MSGKVLEFKKKLTSWEKLLCDFDSSPHREGYLKGLLIGLQKQEQKMDSNPPLKKWLEIRNKIRDVQRLLKK